MSDQPRAFTDDQLDEACLAILDAGGRLNITALRAAGIQANNRRLVLAIRRCKYAGYTTVEEEPTPTPDWLTHRIAAAHRLKVYQVRRVARLRRKTSVPLPDRMGFRLDREPILCVDEYFRAPANRRGGRI